MAFDPNHVQPGNRIQKDKFFYYDGIGELARRVRANQPAPLTGFFGDSEPDLLSEEELQQGWEPA